MTRELAEHWLVVSILIRRTVGQFIVRELHGIENLAGMVEQSGQCGL